MRPFLLTALVLLLSSCASTPPQRLLPNDIAAMEYWLLEGKIAIKHHRESHSGYFSWQQNLEDYTIRIHGPLGQGSARLVSNHRGITLHADGREQSASTAEELMTMNLGWSFPVKDMTWWVRGLASPHSPIDHEERNENGLLLSLEQQGWTLKYLRHQQLDQLTLPYKLIAVRNNTQITLLLKKWEL
jgi:outer membrane lipoprotein LolB